MIAALAGRRVDRSARVEDAIREALKRDAVHELVCAAARGADLLALTVAADLGIRRRIVLPYDAQQFRLRSVVDGSDADEWGRLYDRAVGEATAEGMLRIVGIDSGDPEVYEKTNAAILDEAQAIASTTKRELEAIAVLDNERAGQPDYTAHFAEEARRRGIPVRSVTMGV